MALECSIQNWLPYCSGIHLFSSSESTGSEIFERTNMRLDCANVQTKKGNDEPEPACQVIVILLRLLCNNAAALGASVFSKIGTARLNVCK
jgi:hypothetical protein